MRDRKETNFPKEEKSAEVFMEPRMKTGLKAPRRGENTLISATFLLI